MASYDLVIRGGTVATASDIMKADVGIKGGKIAAIGLDLPQADNEIDAAGHYVLPGGVDPHCHIEQLSASGLVNADTFESATRSAAMGGTTTVIPFAAQHVGMSLKKVVEDYHVLAERGAIVDYAFHMILCDPRPEILKEELPPLARDGHGSLKVFLTYDRLRVDDIQFLDVLEAARKHGQMVCVHAENHGMITWMGKKLIENGHTAPRYHVPSHPRLGEIEAISRAIQCRRVPRSALDDLSRQHGRGRCRDPSGARRGQQGLGRDLHPVPHPLVEGSRQAGDRRRHVDVLAATARAVGSGGSLAGARDRQLADRFVGSCTLSDGRDRQAEPG